jgi:hypothetical protein
MKLATGLYSFELSVLFVKRLANKTVAGNAFQGQVLKLIVPICKLWRKGIMLMQPSHFLPHGAL